MARTDSPEVARLVRELTQKPVAPLEATPPADPGLYAWWVVADHLSDASPAIPPVLAGAEGWSLLYVGISPSSASSSRNLAARIARDHLRGTIGGSTFRQSLAALVRGSLALRPVSGEELCRIVVERVVVNDRRLESIEWTPPARPFFEKQQEYPQADSNR